GHLRRARPRRGLGESDRPRRAGLRQCGDHRRGRVGHSGLDQRARLALRDQARSHRESAVHPVRSEHQSRPGCARAGQSNRLVKLERPQKKAYFTTGHGERSLDGFGPTDYGTIKAALERDNFTTAPINLLTARTVPDDAAEIVIAGPTNPFLAEEKDALKAYM